MFLKKGEKSKSPNKGTESKKYVLSTTKDVERAIQRQNFEKKYEKVKREKEFLVNRFEELIACNDRAMKVKTVLDLIFDVDEKILGLCRSHAANAITRLDSEKGKRWVSEFEKQLQQGQAEKIATFAEFQASKFSGACDIDVNFVSNTSDDKKKQPQEVAMHDQNNSTHPQLENDGAVGGENSVNTTKADVTRKTSEVQRSGSVSSLNPFQPSQPLMGSGMEAFSQSTSGLQFTASNVGNLNFDIPSSSGLPNAALHQDDVVSVTTTSSVRRKRDEVHEQRLKEEVAKHRAEMELTQKSFKYQIERLQREKDEEIRRLNEQLELTNLQATVQSHNDALASLANMEDDDQMSLRNFDLLDATSGPGTTHHQKSRVEKWLNSDAISTPVRRVNFTTEASSIVTSAIQTPLASNLVSQPQQSSNFANLPRLTTTGAIGGPSNSNWQVQAHTTTLDRSLPKLTLKEFDGDPLDWPEWSGMFMSTIGRSNITADEKMSHLKTLLTGPAKRALSGMGYSGALFNTAWRTLQRKFGQPHVIVSSQLAKLTNFQQIRFQDNRALIEFADVVSNFINVLTQFGYTNDVYSSSNLETAVLKLPIDVQRRWYAHVEAPSVQPQLPNLLMFNEWLQQESVVYERLASATSKRSDGSTPKTDKVDKKFQSSQKKHGYNQNFGASEKQAEKDKGKCPLDGEDHKIWKCENFKKKNINERYETVKRLKLCFACLSSLHQIKDCKARVCGINGCEKHHNRLLHQDLRTNNREVLSTSLATDTKLETKGLLQVVTVRLYGGSNKTRDVKAICDSGSSKTWIDKTLSNSLELDGKDLTLHVAGIHGTSPIESKRVNLSLGTTNGEAKINITANTHENIDVGNSVYDLAALKKKYPHLACIKQNKYELENVKVILGQDCYALIRPLEYRRGKELTPWAVKTPLGWTVSGPLIVGEADQCINSSITLISDIELGEQVRKWWEMESYGTRLTANTRSAEDVKATAILESTVRTVGDRYEVGLLWDNTKGELSNNYVTALGQLRSLETRLKRSEGLYQKYEATIETDLAKGYIKEVSSRELAQTKDMKQWYLPHHAVMHPFKPGKVRRVCNAASKYKGLSLNDCLLTGPDLLNNLIGILFRFREHPFAVSADIEAMFMQVLVPEHDQRCLRFLWRDKNERLVVFQYTRHIFGATSSPTCVTFSLRRCAMDNSKEFPRASQVVLDSFYVDDMLNSWHSRAEATKDCLEVQKLLAKGGFKLDKWVSNDISVLSSVTGSSGDEYPDERRTTVLGLKWDPVEDKLEICRGMQHEVRDHWTQRQVLSVVSSIFDPMGIISPFVITARLILKEIWQTQGQNWDSTIDDELNGRFRAWLNDLKTMQSVQVPRCYNRFGSVTTRQIHIFADASQEAFCAVGYLRTELDDATVTVSYLLGKCRVAPKKFQTIPKLELMGALIATRLKDVIVKEHRIEFTSVHFWTDSTTVLQWVQSHTRKHPVFVANRLAEIMDSTTVDQWAHVPGNLNPADLGTRGLQDTRLIADEWLIGPAWLKSPQDEWPRSNIAKPNKVEDVALTSKPIKSPVQWQRFSMFPKLRNVIAWILRWRYKVSCEVLTVPELRRAESRLWLLVQNESFTTEIHSLKKSSELHRSSKILKLSPFVDNIGLLRAQGRLRKSDLEFESKHPIILNSSHYVCKLYLEFIHRSFHHEGVEYLRSIVQERFWILGLRNALRSVKHRCLECKRVKAATFEPTMADLPSSRVSSKVNPFFHTGIDYFGPFDVKFLRRTLKRWVCLFTCLTTRAVHLEVVSSLDTESCMTAIRRFIARRGQPQKIVSDNGTNFVGAKRQFQEMARNWNQHEMTKNMAQKGIHWIFNPPSAPHFGGSWERLVRSCKKAMYHVLGKQTLTEDILLTVITSVEQILNNRPLTTNSSDPGDLEPLTPNHFLLGRASIDYPRCMVENSNAVNFKKAYRASEQFLQSIWQRWMKEYLPQLVARSK